MAKQTATAEPEVVLDPPAPGPGDPDPTDEPGAAEVEAAAAAAASEPAEPAVPVAPAPGEGSGAPPPATGAPASATGAPAPTTGAPPPATGEPPIPAGERGQPSHLWANLRRAEREATELRQQLDQLRQEREQFQARVGQALGVQQPGQQPQGQPGVDRPWTQPELQQLKIDDPLEYANVIAELSYQATQQMGQQNQQRDTQSRIEREELDFLRGNPVAGIEPHPDYIQAREYAREREAARWRAVGLKDAAELPQHQTSPTGMCCVEHAVMMRAGLVVLQALQTGRNVADAVWGWAAADGFTGAAPPPVPGNGAPKPAANPQALVAASRVRSQAAEGSIGNITGTVSGPKRTVPTKQELLDADENDVERFDTEFGEGWEERAAQEWEQAEE